MLHFLPISFVCIKIYNTTGTCFKKIYLGVFMRFFSVHKVLVSCVMAAGLTLQAGVAFSQEKAAGIDVLRDEHKSFASEHQQMKDEHAKMELIIKKVREHIKSHEIEIKGHEKEIAHHGKNLKDAKNTNPALEAEHEKLKAEHQKEKQEHDGLFQALKQIESGISK
jgi:septal ring factor EnvC (AmiA/AmiB activator)